MSSQPPPVAAFLQTVEKFLAAREFSASRFGEDACGDPSFVFDLRNGREPKFSTMEKVRDFMRAHECAPEAEPEPDHAQPQDTRP
jgi:homoserine dehydrogenase